MKKINVLKFFSILFISFISINNFSLAQKENVCQFNRVLFINMRGQDVKCLQQYLIKEKLLNINPSGYYGKLTAKAVRDWKIKYGIKPTTGIFDKKSIKKYLEIITLKTQEEKVSNISILATTIITSTTSTMPLGDLSLPEVSDSQIKIGAEGIKNNVDYFYSLFNKTKDSFSPKEIFSFLERTKDNPLIFVSPSLYIENFLEDKNFRDKNISYVNNDILFFEKVYLKNLEIKKKTIISSQLKDFHKKNIALDILTLDLISKFRDYVNGISQEKEFIDYFQKYKSLMEKERLNIYNLLLNDKSSHQNKIETKYSLLSFVANLFNIKISLAQSFFFRPFGGTISLVKPCPMPPGFVLNVLGHNSGEYFITWGTQIFLWNQVYRPGPNVLGLSLPEPIPCMKWDPGSLFKSGRWIEDFFMYPVIMIGTSL